MPGHFTLQRDRARFHTSAVHHAIDALAMPRTSIHARSEPRRWIAAALADSTEGHEQGGPRSGLGLEGACPMAAKASSCLWRPLLAR